MRLALAASILAMAAPVAAQITIGPIGGGQEPDSQPPAARPLPPQTSTGRTAMGQTARTAYGYRLTAPQEDEDGTDRRVLRRLDTRINNRLETRIERYRFVDTKSDRTGLTIRNPYALRPSAEAAETERVLRRRPPEDR